MVKALPSVDIGLSLVRKHMDFTCLNNGALLKMFLELEPKFTIIRFSNLPILLFRFIF